MSTFSVAQVLGAPQQPGGQSGAAVLATSSSTVSGTSNNSTTANPQSDSAVISQSAAQQFAAANAVIAPLPSVAQSNASDTNAVAQFEQSQAPPPYTLQDFEPNPDRTNAQPLVAASFSPFQIRQFGELLKALSGVTSSVLPHFSYSA